MFFPCSRKQDVQKVLRAAHSVSGNEPEFRAVFEENISWKEKKKKLQNVGQKHHILDSTRIHCEIKVHIHSNVYHLGLDSGEG